jgi:putative nucleotidyltransferase with HDIG domain
MSFVPSDDQETSLEEFKLNERSSKGLTVSKEQTLRGHLGNVKTNSPWELFVSSTSFDHLSQLTSEADDEEEKTDPQDIEDHSEDLMSPFIKRLLHISVLGFKRRFKEAFDLAESSQYNVEFDGWERTRLQVEAVWQRYMHRPDQEAKQCIRRLSELYVQSQRAYTSEQMQELKPVIYLYQGRIHYDQKHFGVAMRWYKEALMCCPEESLTHARLLDSMAIYYEHAGNFSHALHLMQDSLKIKGKLPFIHELGVSYQMLGQTNLLVEQFDDAQKHLERALSIAIQVKDSRREAEMLNDLIKIAIINHQLIKALHLTNECMSRCQARRLWSAYGTARLYRAYIHFLNNELDQTHTLLVDEIIPLLKDYSNEKAYGTAFRLLGALYNSWGQRREALEALTESIVIFKRQNRHDELAKTYYEQARLYIFLQQKDLAIKSLFHALNVAQQYNLMFLVRPIEDELFILAPEKWEKIAEHRLKYEAFTPLETMLKAHVVSPENIQAAAMKVMNGSTKLDESVNGLASANPNALMSLLRLGQAISAERELDNILNLVREETVKALCAERCTVFVYDKETNELWSKVASGMEGNKKLRVSADKGLVGHVLKVGETLNIADVYNDPRFNQEVDRKTGYRTRNVLCIPILNRDNEPIGVVQVLNKVVGAFNKSDEDLLNAIAATTGITLENAMMVQEQKRSFESFILTLSSTIDARDPITAGHSERVADYSLLVGDELQMHRNDMEVLRFAALLHDIGKIGIREEVLTKEGRLTIDEYQHIQEHARFTFEILQNIHFAHHLQDVPLIAASHHERVDGKGYYKGLKGDEIPLSGRIIALGDVFDAITSLRHYRSRMPFDKVLSIIQKDAGSHFDSEVVAMFFRVPLYRLAEVLVKERRVKKIQEVSPLVKYIDRHVNLAEFHQILTKPEKTKAEQEIDKYFSAIYYVLPSKQQDNL